MATIVKQSLLPELETMERRFRRILEPIGLMPALLPAAASIPAADVFETPGEIVVELEVPGFAEGELEIEIWDRTLSISGSREEFVEPETEKAFRLRERLERSFERSFLLPPETDVDHVTATFEKGVLTVHAPKFATPAPHKVAISS